MKSKVKNIIISSLILIGCIISTSTFADPPGMPGGHGETGDQVPGGGAPIGGGALILTTLAIAYAVTKKKVEYTIVEEE